MALFLLGPDPAGVCCDCSTRTNPCDSCGGQCCFTIPSALIDGGPPPRYGNSYRYSSLTTAQGVLTDRTAGCLVEGAAITRTAFSASFTNGIYSIVSNGTLTNILVAEMLTDIVLTRVYAKASDGLSINYHLDFTYPGSIGPNSFSVRVYADDQTTIINSVTGTVIHPFVGTLNVAIPSDGYYYILSAVQITSDTPGTWTTSISLTCTGGTSFSPCKLRAAYDSGGGVTAYAYGTGCATCSLSCSQECVDTFDNGCGLIITGISCLTGKNTAPPCSPGGPDSIQTTTSNVRLRLTGLSIGTTYNATVFFCSYNPTGSTSYTVFNFVATSSEEVTSYTAVPAAILNGQAWYVCYCLIAPA